MKELVYYCGAYWWTMWLIDHMGRVSLISLKDNSVGCAALPGKVKTLSDDEKEKQMKAIEYWRMEGEVE